MLNDVAGSIAFSLASPDPFTSITGAQGEPALICEKHRAPVADMPILVFYSKCQSSSTVLGSEHRAHYRTSRPEATLMKCVSDCLGRDIHSSGLLEVSAQPVPPCTKQQISVLLMGLGPSTALSSSPRVTACLLESPPCFGDCAGRHIKSPCNGTRGCAILEELDNLCNFCRVKKSPHAPSSDNDSS